MERAKGFVGTGDDTQYAIDQSVADHVVETISTFAHDWTVRYAIMISSRRAVKPSNSQGTLTPSAYVGACGFIVEETIVSVLNDILSHSDIPELESHRLNSLCQRLYALKDLFILEAGKVNSTWLVTRARRCMLTFNNKGYFCGRIRSILV